MEEEKAEIDLDFSKIFSFAKNLNFENVKNKISLVIGFIRDHKTLCVLLLVILLQFIPNLGFLPWGGIWMRMQTKELSSVDNFVAFNLNNRIKANLSQDVLKDYNNLPDMQKKEILNEKFKDWLVANKEIHDEALKKDASNLKAFLSFNDKKRSFPYPFDIDAFNYLVYARNYLDHRYLGDGFNRTGTSWDYLSLAPLGKNAVIQANLHPFVLARFYKFWSFFDSSVHIFYSSSYLPIIFVLFSLIFMFFLTDLIGFDFYGVFFSVTVLAIHQVILKKTFWGLFDTDIYVLFFPLLISFLFFKSFFLQGLKKYFLLMIMAFVFFVFARAWVGWWFIFYLFFFSLILTVFYEYFFMKRKERAKESLFVLIFVVFSFILISSVFLYFGNSDFVFLEGSSNVYTSFFYNSLIRPPFEMLGFKQFKPTDVFSSNLWPNVYDTVKELKRNSLGESVKLLGIGFIVLSFVGMIFFLVQSSSDKTSSFLMTVFFSSWFVLSFYAGLKSVRFFFLLIPVLSILSGAGILFLKEKAHKILNRANFSNYFFMTFILLLTCFIFFPLVRASYLISFGSESEVVFPRIDDAWWEALNYIKDNSQENAIVTTWWDFGHPIKFISERGTTFDGASQNSPLAYWVGRILLTSDEKEAVGILRMLDCGSDSVVELVQNKIKNMAKSVNLLVEISKLDKEQARQVLIQKGFDDETTKNILDLTHCNPPQAFLILSSDMISKAYAWGHFGGWDFLKADLWFNYEDKTKKEITNYFVSEYDFSQENAEKFYDEFKKARREESDKKEELSWIGNWPNYISDLRGNYFVACDNFLGKIVCPNGIIFSGGNIHIENSAGEMVPLKRGIYVDSNRNWTINENSESVGLDAVLVSKGEEYFGLLAKYPLSNSVFTKLFFLNNYASLKHFNFLKEINQLLGGKIYVWEINWAGKPENRTENIQQN
ncbi:hypothetical protein HZA97_03470 [Candidatus Woesearchaeota archaeon]|nr:hypothetical protein [Candidatus Woesearchaeota archaeon]